MVAHISLSAQRMYVSVNGVPCMQCPGDVANSNGNRVALKRHFSDEVSTQVGKPWNELLAMLSDETLRRRHPESKTYFPLGGLLVTADR